MAKSKLCKPVLIVVSVHGILLSIKLDHITSHVLHLNSPGATSGFIVLRSNMNGMEVAIEILKKFPLACIIFITAFEMLEKELSKQDIFCDKKIDVLIKPIKLNRIQNSLLSLLRK